MRLEKMFIVLAVAVLGPTAVPAQQQVSLTVDATMDIYRAGGYNDGSDGIAPVVFSFPARAWTTMTLPSVGGAWTCTGGVAENGADGIVNGQGCIPPSNIMAPVGSFSGYATTDFSAAMMGMFLEDSLPGSAPPSLRFYYTNSSKGGTATDFLTLAPQIGQVFFIGDGLTGTGGGSTQTFSVPPTATHLYLGYVDSCSDTPTVPSCYSDNLGSLNVTVRLQDHVPDWVKPTLSSAPSARICPAMSYDAATHSTVLFGGSSAFFPGSTYGDTWTWGRGQWTQLFPAASPPARMCAATAYDPTTGTVVLFGGEDWGSGAVFGDTWTWDGVTWTQQFPPVSPPARYAVQAMAYDPVTRTAVLFGGIGANTGGYGGAPFGDTWVWNGKTKTWTQKFPLASPSPRTAPLTYDENTKTVVLFGGDNGGGDCCNIYYNDTWTWDGVTWTQQTPDNSPPPRVDHSMVYDPGLGQVVFTGGFSTPGQGLSGTWAWNGKTWKQLNLANQPSARWASGMVFDPLSEGLVLFGGELSGDIVTNETWLLVPVPVQ